MRVASRSSSVRVQALFGTKAAPTEGVYAFEVDDIDGRPVKLSKYKGQVLLVVNLASACGFTPQYTELQQLHEKFSKKGLTILGFPCNQFGAQEPGSNSQIKKFAQQNYGAKFPLFSKVDVNGSGADPLFDYLKSQKGGFLGNDIKWNFTKFLLNKEGKVVGRYGSTTAPSQIEADIAKLL
jgi:glutathione peroxidase